MTKLAAHDKWVCLRCRWTAKIPLVDDRVPDRPSYRCPKCRGKMVCTGTAFRPPRKSYEERWLVVEKLLAAGFRFWTTSQRRRVPRTLRDFDAWLAEQQRADTWLAERRPRIRPGKRGPLVRCGERYLMEGEHLLLWLHGEWEEGRLGFRGDAGVVLQSPVVKLTRRRRSVPLFSGARLRLCSKRNGLHLKTGTDAAIVIQGR